MCHPRATLHLTSSRPVFLFLPFMLRCTFNVLARRPAHQSLRFKHAMNQPRNRQPRPPRTNDRRGPPRGPPRDSSSSVPSVQQVTPGASVSIVLKADQPTGREVQGVVQDLLTRGNHPRGIKVRLQDGRIGRVQRMTSGAVTTAAPASNTIANKPRVLRMERDFRLDEADYPSGPPPRNLLDFVPQLRDESEGPSHSPEHASFSSATAKCPICELFEGDEVAVSRHVEEHLT